MPPAPHFDIDAIAADYSAAWALIGETLDDGWAETAPGVTAAVSGVHEASLNSVIVTGDAEVGDVERLLQRVAASGLPHGLTARPQWAERADAAALARQHGLKPVGPDVPLMAVRLPLGAASLTPAQPTPTPRALAPDEAPLHAAIAAAAFDIPVDVIGGLVTPAVLAAPAVDAYVAGDPPVSTVLSIQTGTTIGIFDTGTRPEARGHRLGAAVVAHALNTAATRGARVAWLQPTPKALPFYERMGFATLETWPTWRVI
jgi:GNAT superfamily N-acetyltransferase